MAATGDTPPTSLKTPAAIFLYRRPELVQPLLAGLRAVRPPRVWLVADGPKQATEAERCLAARREAEEAIDWPCEVRRVYADTNLGLKNRIETGLDAVFAREEQAIILEEDCHPAPDFFPFCEAMLKKYSQEPKVGAVSGNCFLPKTTTMTTDYYFSRYVHIWGWATWGRAWKNYDRNMWSWPAGGFRQLFPDDDLQEVNYWNRIFDRIVAGTFSTWDYSWISWFWMNGWVSITPAQNLVRNAGFGPEATNTRDVSVETGMERHGRLTSPYRGPEDIRADPELDREVFQNHLLRQEGRLSFWPRIRRSLMKRIGC
jgi:hypothetical protein